MTITDSGWRLEAPVVRTRDVETVAERLNVSVSGAETEAIICILDTEIDDLTRTATRRAVESRLVELLGVVDRAHAESDDD